MDNNDLGASANAETGSHAPHEAPWGLRPPGFDPARGWPPKPWEAKPAFNTDDTHRIMWRECGQGWARERRLDRDCAGGFSPAVAKLIAASPELYGAGVAVDLLLRRMQKLTTEYLIPDGGLADETYIIEIIGLLDGPDQRAAQHALQAALAKAAV